ncbi:hypothetical protein PIB30_079396 [Stylosanthes scabra]|uniref:Ubiquitin-like protease family profile domain-containing protein n=1 Tax=Stylosanthes scabra TaxID=79078 RepID=A0ABU6YPD3_9FABA|nr:hypothetical protein [Stylosanthes scabra]
MPEEILNIPPINEIIPAIIQEDLLTANEKKKIYNWVMNASKDSGVQEEMIATFHGYRNIFLLRMEFRCLKPRKWINSPIINWKIKEMNNSDLPRFTKEFYCVVSGILGEYIGMNPNLGLDKENFDKEKTTTRQWAFNIVKKELLVLDSLFDHVFDDKRILVDIYVGKIVEDMLNIVIPTYHHTETWFQCCYTKVPKQPNNDDCGICMINLMESWTENSNLKEYNDVSQAI